MWGRIRRENLEKNIHCQKVQILIKNLNGQKQLASIWKGIFSEVFKKDVKVTLLKSIKTGADKCVIEVEW